MFMRISFSRIFRLRGRRSAAQKAPVEQPSSTKPQRQSQLPVSTVSLPETIDIRAPDPDPDPAPPNPRRRSRFSLLNPLELPLFSESSESQSQTASRPTTTSFSPSTISNLYIPAPIPTTIPMSLLAPSVSAPTTPPSTADVRRRSSMIEPTSVSRPPRSQKPKPKPASAPQSTPASRRVSFQVPPRKAAGAVPDSPVSPTSTSSTLVIGPEAARGEVANGHAPRPSGDSQAQSQPPASAEPAPTSTPPSSWSRRASFFAPLPIRVNKSRFSLPVSSAETTSPTTSTKESKRTSLVPAIFTSNSGSGSGSTAKKERRRSRWSREMDKPETQEVLKALSEL